MNEELALLAELSPLAAVVIIAGVAASALTQWAKRPSWTKARAQGVALVIALVVGLLAYIVAGVASVFPASFVDVVSTAAVVIAGVAVMSRGAYSLIGHAIPDGREHAADGGVHVEASGGGASPDEVARGVRRALDPGER